MCSLLTHNNVKSEISSPITSAKRVAVFQSNLMLASEEDGEWFFNKDNKQPASHASKCLLLGM